MSKHYRKQNDCLNCGATVQSKFCSNCGQENLDLHEPFWHFISHSIGHYFHFDTKFFNSIVPLIIKPGQLTLDYIEGKRTRYLQPISMFIFISIVYFLFTPYINPKEEVEASKRSIINQIKTPSELFKETKDNEGIKYLPKKLKVEALKALKEAQLQYFRTLKNDRQNEIIDSFKVLAFKQKSPSEINLLIKDLYTAKTKPLKEIVDDDKALKINKEKLNKKETFEKYGAKVLFILTPIFAFFLMTNFRKNKKYYVEHVIFTLHFHSFAFIALFITSILNFISFNYIPDILYSCTYGIFIWYMYKSLKLTYQRSGRVTLRKMVTLSFFYLLAYGISITFVQFVVNSIPK